MVHILARLSFQPDKASAAREILESLVHASRKEPGCRAYQLFRQADAAHVLQTVEEWADEAAADGHMHTPHVVAALAAITPMFSAAPDIVRFQKLV